MSRRAAAKANSTAAEGGGHPVNRGRTARPWLFMGALAAAVLALHGWLLQALRPHPPTLRMAGGGLKANVNVRRVELPAPAPVPAPPAAALRSEPKAPAVRAPRASAATKNVASGTVTTPTRLQRAKTTAAPVASPVPPALAAPAAPTPTTTSPASSMPSPQHATAVLDTALLPAAMRLHYAVTRARGGDGIAPGHATLDWQPSGDRYSATLQIVPPGGAPARRQHSAGRILGAQGLAPERFADRLRSEEAAHFDAAAGRVVFSANRPPVALQPGAQDRLSALLQLAGLLAAAPAARQAPGQAIALQVATTRDADMWSFTIEALEDLALPGGPVQALRLVRLPVREWDLKVELWLAPGHAYAPVRLRLTPAAGDWVDLQWSRTDKG